MKKFLKSKYNTILGLFISLLVILLLIVANNFDVFEQFELNLLDFRFKKLVHLKENPDKNIVIIGIDDISVKEIGRWPWKRNEHARIIDFLKLFGAKAVVYDIFFTQKDFDNPDADKQLALSIKKSKNVYLASKFILTGSEKFEDAGIEKLIPKFALNATGIPYRDLKQTISDNNNLAYEVPFSELAESSRKVGSVHIGKSDDGKVRYQDLIYKYQDKLYPSLSLALIMDLVNENKISFNKQKGYVLKDLNVPLDRKNQMIINWQAFYDEQHKKFKPPYKQYSAWRLIDSQKEILRASKYSGLIPEEIVSVINSISQYKGNEDNILDELWNKIDKLPPDFELKFDGNNPTELFKDKIVFVGVASTLTTVRDFISTPYFQEIPGVYLHANVVDNLLNSNLLKRFGKGTSSFLIFLIGLITALSIILGKNSVFKIYLPISIAVIYFLVSLFAFYKFNFWLDVIYVETAIFLLFSLLSSLYYFLEGKDKLRIKQAFANYMAPQVMNEVLSDPAKLNLGGTKRELTILFSDIRNFTTISESHDPQEIVQMLNEYFSEMVDIIIKNNGTLDKFIGDAIMAFWNAPLETKDHAYLAVKTAVEMLEALERLNERWNEQGKITIGIGIGVNTGEVIVGNIGSSKIKDYTIIGDGVNAASRLEGLNKEFDTRLLISEATYESIKDRVNAVYIGSKKVKGKDKPIRIYEVIGLQ